jgi:hypothetical protein
MLRRNEVSRASTARLEWLLAVASLFGLGRFYLNQYLPLQNLGVMANVTRSKLRLIFLEHARSRSSQVLIRGVWRSRTLPPVQFFAASDIDCDVCYRRGGIDEITSATMRAILLSALLGC